MSTGSAAFSPGPDVLQALWAQSADLIAVMTPEGRFRFASPSYQRMLGYAPEDLRDTSVGDCVHPDDQARVVAAIAAAAKAPAALVAATFRCRHADGSWRTIEAAMRPLQPDMAPADVLVVGHDISALRDFEHTQEEFLSSAAHDLKTPLTAIRGHTGLARLELSELPGAAPSLRHLDQIEAGTLRMARLIDELVDVTRTQMGAALELEMETVDLVALVRGVVAQQADLSAHQIRVTTAMPDLWATIDAARIERVVSNLLSNAVKYSPPDQAIVVHLARSDGAAAPAAVIGVQDRGVGIPPGDLPHIFERFRRARNVVGRVRGTGIGLASVRQIVEQHGGSVQAESVLGEGATFTVRLPLGASTGRDDVMPVRRAQRRKERRRDA